MQHFIDPKTLARINDLPLAAKTIAEGFLFGIQQSMQRGIGIEFSQYRSYEVGDAINRIDWKLFARSDRYYIREADRESEIDIWFLLDSSLSMKQFSQSKDSLTASEKNWSKFEYAKYLIASLSYIAQKQGDGFGYLSLNDNQLNSHESGFLPIGNSTRQWQKLLVSLAQTKLGQFFPNVSLLQHQLENIKKPSMIFVLSDFHQKSDEILTFLSKLNTSLSEVVALQLICEDEKHFNYQGTIRFKDLETNQEKLVSAKDIKKSYLLEYHASQQLLQKDLADLGISLQTLNIDKPLDEALFNYLRLRNRVTR